MLGGIVFAQLLSQFLDNLQIYTQKGSFFQQQQQGIFFAEAQILAKIQAAMAIQENKNTTLHSGEISKYGRKTGSIQVTAGGKSYAVRLFDEDVGTAERLVDSIKNSLEKTAEHRTKVKKNGSTT